MLLFYIDESGTGLEDKQTPFFVLAAVAIPADQWQSVDSRTTTLKRRLVSWAKSEDFEIKGRDLRRGEKLFKNRILSIDRGIAITCLALFGSARHVRPRLLRRYQEPGLAYATDGYQRRCATDSRCSLSRLCCPGGQARSIGRRIAFQPRHSSPYSPEHLSQLHYTR